MTDQTANQSLKGKVAIVTGASKNLGGESAKLLGSKGASVVVHYHNTANKKGAEEVAAAIKNAGGKASIYQASLTNPPEISGLFDYALESFGGADILVNTMGIMLKKPVVQVTEEEYDRMFNVHTKAAFFLMKEAAQKLRDEGRVINFSTTITSMTTGLYAVYTGAKAAIEQFTKALAKEIGNRKITVNTIAPGPLNTSFFYPAEDEHSIQFVKYMSVQNRLGELSDVIPLVAFLASQEAGWITGQTIRVNGGMM